MDARPIVVAPLLMAAILYLAGWSRLAVRVPSRCRPALVARLAMALLGLTAVAVALLALHAPAHERFSAHMLQHLLLVVGGVPLLLLADPLPAVLWALPRGPRRAVRRLLASGGVARALARRLTRPALAWSLHVAALWLWHWPPAYDAALGSGALHDLEHLTLAATAVLFWWPILEPAPRLAPAPALGIRVGYLVLAAFSSAALGLVLVTAPEPLYAYGVVDDQALGGVLMWTVGSVVDMAAVLALVWRALGAASLTGLAPHAKMQRLDP